MVGEWSFQGYFRKDGDLSLFDMGDIILINMHPGKASCIFPFADSFIKFSGDFDSGNLKNVTQLASLQVHL
jgi:hypothetical protein